jgi:polyhydroxyalkanoate synthesis regulator phasin
VRKLIWLPLAGALLIGGAAVAAAAPDLVDDVTSSLASVPVRAGGLLADVLADLVAEGVITQEQSDAITGELETRGEQRRAELAEQRAQMRAFAEQMREFFEDGAITAAEVAQLPDGDLKTILEALLEDGDITIDRLREMGGLFFLAGPHFAGPGHHLRGAPPGWVIPDQGS